MPRLLVHVEGETEEEFVNEILAGHLRAAGMRMSRPGRSVPPVNEIAAAALGPGAPCARTSFAIFRRRRAASRRRWSTITACRRRAIALGRAVVRRRPS